MITGVAARMLVEQVSVAPPAAEAALVTALKLPLEGEGDGGRRRRRTRRRRRRTIIRRNCTENSLK